jgi:hypothetical protein
MRKTLKYPSTNTSHKTTGTICGYLHPAWVLCFWNELYPIRYPVHGNVEEIWLLASQAMSCNWRTRVEGQRIRNLCIYNTSTSLHGLTSHLLQVHLCPSHRRHLPLQLELSKWERERHQHYLHKLLSTSKSTTMPMNTSLAATCSTLCLSTITCH